MPSCGRVDLEGDYPYTGWIPPEYRNWTQVYTRPVLEGQDNGPGLSVNEDNILNYNGTEDGRFPLSPALHATYPQPLINVLRSAFRLTRCAGFYACLLDGVFTLYFGEEPDTNKPGQQCLNITLNATDV